MQKTFTNLALAALFATVLAGICGPSSIADNGSASADWGYDGNTPNYNSSGGNAGNQSSGGGKNKSSDSVDATSPDSVDAAPPDSVDVKPPESFNSTLDSLDARLGGHASPPDDVDASPSDTIEGTSPESLDFPARTTNRSTQKHSILEVTDANADQEIFFETRPVFADFYTTWCGPCKKLSPVIEQLSEEYKDRVKFVKVNAEKATQLAYKYEVMAYPTMKVIAPKTKKAKTLIGFHDIARLRSFLDKSLKEFK